MKRICGFDASTTTIGFCAIDYDENSIKLAHFEYFKPPKKGDVFERLSAVRKYVFDRLDCFKPDSVALEEIVLFMANKTTARTITSLAALNRTVGVAVLDQSGRSPISLNVMKIRHTLKLDKVFPKKSDMPDLVAHHLGISFPWVFNKNGKVRVENEDVADSIAVALTAIKVGSLEVKTKKKKKKNGSKKSI